MANGIDYEALLDDDNETDESQLLKQLRKALRASRDENKSLTAQVAEVGKQSRAASLKQILESKQVRPGVARFYPADADVTEDEVNKWLQENSEDLGITIGEARQASDTLAVTDPAADQLRRMQAAQNASTVTAPPSDLSQFDAQIRKIGSDRSLTPAQQKAALQELYGKLAGLQN